MALLTNVRLSIYSNTSAASKLTGVVKPAGIEVPSVGGTVNASLLHILRKRSIPTPALAKMIGG